MCYLLDSCEYLLFSSSCRPHPCFPGFARKLLDYDCLLHSHVALLESLWPLLSLHLLTCPSVVFMATCWRSLMIAARLHGFCSTVVVWYRYCWRSCQSDHTIVGVCFGYLWLVEAWFSWSGCCSHLDNCSFSAEFVFFQQVFVSLYSAPCMDFQLRLCV